MGYSLGGNVGKTSYVGHYGLYHSLFIEGSLESQTSDNMDR